MKTSPKAAIAVAASVCGAVTASNIADFYQDRYQTMKNLQVVDEHLYALDYCSDYNLDAMLEKGTSNVGEMLSICSKTMLNGAKLFKLGKGGFACSTFNAVNEAGESLLGRNFDYKSAPCMAVWTHPENGYASVAMADCNFMLYGYKSKPVKKQKRLQLLLAPYACMDGVNEKGFAVAILEVKTKATKQETGKLPISTTVLLRALLDRCATVEEGLAFMQSYDVHDALFCCYHYQMTDATGASVIVEYINNEMRIHYPDSCADSACNYQCCTNFFLSEDGDNAKGFGYERFDKMKETLAEKKGCMNEKDALKLLEDVKLHYKHDTYPWWVISLWSAVYNNRKKTATLVAGMDYEHPYELSATAPGVVNKLF